MKTRRVNVNRTAHGHASERTDAHSHKPTLDEFLALKKRRAHDRTLNISREQTIKYYYFSLFSGRRFCFVLFSNLRRICRAVPFMIRLMSVFCFLLGNYKVLLFLSGRRILLHENFSIIFFLIGNNYCIFDTLCVCARAMPL